MTRTVPVRPPDRPDDRDLIRVLLDPTLTRAEADGQLRPPARDRRLPPPEQVRAARPRYPRARD